MKRSTVIAVTVFAVALTTLALAAPDDRKAAVLLQAAEAKETIEGDLKGAIVLYQQAADEPGATRSVAARALFALATSYQKLGVGDARSVFARIVREFADQKDIAALARVRLAALGAATPQSEGLSTRRVFTGDSFVMNGISLDGRLAVGYTIGVSGNGAMVPDVVIRDTVTGQTTRVVPGSQSGYGSDPVLSADTRQVAYFWGEGINGDGSIARTSLRVSGTEPGALPRTIATDSWFAPIAWSLDGAAVLVKTPSDLRSAGGHASGHVAWVSVADGTVRMIKEFDLDQDERGTALSPNGSLIAYSALVRPGSSERHIYVMDIDGQNETDVVKIAGANTEPIWTPDGSHLLFMSDRSGSRSLWSVTMQNGVASGQPVLLQAGFTGKPIGMSASGALYYSQSSAGGPSVFIAERHPGSARVVQAFAGADASWSPDGKSVAFVRVNGGVDVAAGRYALIVRSVETGDERLYPHDGTSAVSPQWLPDSSGLIVLVRPEGDGGRAGGSFYRVDVKTGEFKWLFARVADDHIRSPITALSPDGRTLYVTVRKAQNPSIPTAGIAGVDPSTGAERPIGTFPGAGLLGPTVPGIAVSPDGASLAVMAHADQPGAKARLITVNVDGTGYRQLYGPFPAELTSDLTWTPDGQAILFATLDEATGVGRVMRISRNGGQPEFDGLDTSNLTGSVSIPRLRPGGVASIGLSPDGSHIVFDAQTLDAFEVWTLENVMAALNPRH